MCCNVINSTDVLKGQTIAKMTQSCHLIVFKKMSVLLFIREKFLTNNKSAPWIYILYANIERG